MFIKKVKQALILAMTINTILSLFMLAFFYYQIGLYNNLCTLMFIIILIIEWYSVLYRDKKFIPIKQYLEQFIEKHSQDIQPYEKEAQSAFIKFTKLSTMQMIIYSYFIKAAIFIISYYSIYNSEAHLLLISFFLFITIFSITFISAFIITPYLNKKNYFHYINTQNNGYIYILMTYYLLQLTSNDEFILKYVNLFNVSGAFANELYFEEGYAYIQIWRYNLKKFSPILQFLYINHCMSHLSMLDRHDEVELAYQDYLATQKRYPKYENKKLFLKISYSVSLTYAYDKQDWQTIIDLEKSYYQYFDKLQDHAAYYFYCAYKHIEEEKAEALLQKYQNNKFFKKYIINE